MASNFVNFRSDGESLFVRNGEILLTNCYPFEFELNQLNIYRQLSQRVLEKRFEQAADLLANPNPIKQSRPEEYFIHFN